MEELKSKLKDLITSGKIDKAIKQLVSMDLDSSKKDKVAAIASRYNRYKEEKNQGTLTYEQATVTENQIVASLIEVVNNLDKKEIKITGGGGLPLKPILLSLAGVIIIALILFQSGVFSKSGSDNLQLTVFVQDEAGNPVLENEGKLNIPLGNRALNSLIGPNGRTNFADITGDNVGDSIVIGLEAEGWEIVDGKNAFVFDGEPIKLTVMKDESLGIVKGVVKSRDGQEFIQGASVTIGADTVITTNASGVFNTTLPSHMRVTAESTPYNLTISAPGYKTTTQYYYPGQSTEIRLNKN
ncbi:MAG: carboxypeptidase regulatory-like domain-containing protein [Saprospiraceae bacterium]|nr:carboxypeptidase regulatory-like domain-containing protein [Saprospiraceae bacterium]